MRLSYRPTYIQSLSGAEWGVFFLIFVVGIYNPMIAIVFGDCLVFISTLDGDRSNALSHPEDDLLNLDGSRVPLGSIAVNKSTGSIYYRIEKGTSG